jgi:hypothetical protein
LGLAKKKMSVPQRDSVMRSAAPAASHYGYAAPPLTAAHFTPRYTGSHYPYPEPSPLRTGARYPLYSGSAAAEPSYTGARYPYGLTDDLPTHTGAHMSARSTGSRYTPSSLRTSYDSPTSTGSHYNPNPYSSSGGAPLTGLRYSPPGSQYPAPLYNR